MALKLRCLHRYTLKIVADFERFKEENENASIFQINKE